MPHKLLLADDSVTIQRVIELTFAGEDVDVLTAGDGEQAIASIQTERPDIVLADIGMPKRSGYDVAVFVKTAPEFSHIPVLLLTGAFEPVDENRARATGCDGVLVKPFEPQHVIARVRELLQGASRRIAQPPASVTRAVADVPRPAERLAPQRQRAVASADELDASLPAAPTTTGLSETSLDEYFDRLDAAFASITTAGAPAHPSPPPSPAASAAQPAGMEPPPAADRAPRREGPVREKDLDWFDQPAVPPQPVTPIPEAPVTFASPPSASPAWPLPQAPAVEPADTPAVMAPRPAEPAPRVVHVTPSDSGSTIADAFSALLAAEQGEPGAAPVRLAVAAAPVNDDMIETITRRVIERLGPDAARDLVADVVSRVAERLVREEIQRIRSKHT